MQAGKLRHQINIEHRVTSGSDGMGNSMQTWRILYQDVPAQINPFSARETWYGATAQSETTHRVILRYVDGIDSTMRVTFNGRVFDVLGLANDQERNIMLTLDCKENFSEDVPAVLVSVRSQTGVARITARELQTIHGTARIEAA